MGANLTTTRHNMSWTMLKVLLAAGWLLVSVVDLASAVALSGMAGRSIRWSSTWVAMFGFWGLHAALAPFLVWALARVPFERGRVGRAIAWSTGLLPAYWCIHFLMRYVWEGVVLRPGTSSLIHAWLREPDFLEVYLMGTIFVFLVTSAAALQREKADLRASLTEARLEALRAQLQPHFLFNALHAISTLILKGDTREANEMLSHLSQFLRMTLDNADTPTVPLAVELEFLDAYLSIQRARFGDRLQVTIDIDQRARPVAVPSLIFQPLVENSIHHGIASDCGRGLINIRARIVDGNLMLEVEDNGKGLSEGAAASDGIGLGNIRERLEQLYPGSHSFVLEEGAAGGARARITIPARRVPNAREVADHAP
jgi:two-component sensor histidine kinase